MERHVGRREDDDDVMVSINNDLSVIDNYIGGSENTQDFKWVLSWNERQRPLQGPVEKFGLR